MSRFANKFATFLETTMGNDKVFAWSMLTGCFIGCNMGGYLFKMDGNSYAAGAMTGGVIGGIAGAMAPVLIPMALVGLPGYAAYKIQDGIDQYHEEQKKATAKAVLGASNEKLQ